MSNVSLVKCDSYNYKAVKKAVGEALSLLGGLERFVKKGNKVLIKPNLLAPKLPEQAITTHPSIVQAVAEEVLNLGANPIVSDSPGMARFGKQSMEKTGMSQIGKELNIQALPLESNGFVKTPLKNSSLKFVHYAKIAKTAEVIINIAKLKTHMQTFYTGAIKNMFGAIAHKERMQAHNVGGYKLFSEVLVDIFFALKPQLNLMDGIIGMEGNGPSQGTPKKVGVILASSDAVALDAVSTYLTGYDVFKVLTTKIAHQQTLGEADLNKINIENGDLDSLKVNFKKPPTIILTLSNSPVWGVISKLVKVSPYINPEICQTCNVCAEVCPAGAIQYEKEPFINPKICIECFCCHEMCPHEAIEVKENIFAKILEKIEGEA